MNDQYTEDQKTIDRLRTMPTRRTLIKAGAGAAAVALTGAGVGAAKIAQAQESTPSATSSTLGTPTTCVLTPDLTEGPYYLDDMLVRADITEGKPGVPLTLRIAVQDITACGPIADAAVEIWHCDAQGYYSGIVGENPGGGGEATGEENASTTFLRGIQMTDAGGAVEFQSIYPGWYTSRTVHIHMKVHHGGAGADGETYEGGTTSHTGQLFFADELSDEVFATEAYVRSNEEGKLTNDEDNIFDEHGDEPGFLMETTGSVTDGLIGTIVIGVDPTATSAEGGMDGGAGGGPGGPGGEPPEGGPGGTPPGDG